MTHHIDVCNGDADGLCSVLQWRLARPANATLVTGLKRDIRLLEGVQAGPGDEVLVCDLSMQANRAALLRLLEQGVRVSYFDHHVSGPIPQHPGLHAHIDFSSEVCTSILMDRHLGGQWRAWAVVGAYGDNLDRPAGALADTLGLDERSRASLRTLGQAINYNAYGEREEDVHVAPGELYRILARYRDPFELLVHEPVCRELEDRRAADLLQACSVPPCWEDAQGSVHLLPDEQWSRRVMGALAHELASAAPDCAHVVAVPDAAQGLRLSVRAPLSAPGGANALCARFGGAGRAAAGGIDHLPREQLGRFIEAFAEAPWG